MSKEEEKWFHVVNPLQNYKIVTALYTIDIFIISTRYIIDYFFYIQQENIGI